MAHYISRAANPRIPDYLVIKVSVPAGQTMTAGALVPVAQLDNTIPNNWQVFTGAQPAAANLGVRMALVINDGFETLPDGRRPAGQPDYTQYVYHEGDVVTAILLVPGLMFEIGMDCLTNADAVAVGNFIEPVAGQYFGSVKAARTDGTESALKVIYTGKNFRLGGMMGGEFATTVVAMAV